MRDHPMCRLICNYRSFLEHSSVNAAIGQTNQAALFFAHAAPEKEFAMRFFHILPLLAWEPYIAEYP